MPQVHLWEICFLSTGKREHERLLEWKFELLFFIFLWKSSSKCLCSFPSVFLYFLCRIPTWMVMFYCGCTLCHSAVIWNTPTWQLSVCNNEPFWRTAAGRVAPWCAATDDLVNGTDDTADEIMERIVRSATQGPSQRMQPRERRRSRVNRKSREWRPPIH